MRAKIAVSPFLSIAVVVVLLSLSLFSDRLFYRERDR